MWNHVYVLPDMYMRIKLQDRRYKDALVVLIGL